MLFAFFAFFSLKFVKFFANIHRIDAYVDNFVHFFERITFQFSFTNINEKLFENEKLIKLCDNDLIVNLKYIKRKKSRAIIFKKNRLFFVVFDFIRFVIEQLDFKVKFANVDINFLFFIFFFEIQNSNEMTSHFIFYLIAVIDDRFICRRISQYKMLFVINNVIKCNKKMQFINVLRISIF